MKNKREMIRRVMSMMLMFALIFSMAALSGCAADESRAAENTAPASAENEDIETFMAMLAAMNGVSDVSIDEDGLITAMIEQPLDWAGGTDKTFKQMFTIEYAGADKPVCFCAGGYDISTCTSEMYLFPDNYEYNAVRMEYRFYGDSTPEGPSAASADMWEYLTVENAAEDFHAIISLVRSLLPGKAVMTGVSKGGFTTNFQAYKYPLDADLFIPFCAPLCSSDSDSALYDFLNERIGNEELGEEVAAEVREVILDFQLECMRYKDDLKKAYKELALELVENGEDDYRPVLMEDDGAKFFDLAVADLKVAIWMMQGYNVGFGTAEGIKSVLGDIISMPADTAEEIKAKEDALLDILASLSSPDSYSCSLENVLFAYTVQTAMQMGNYAANLAPLRERIAAEQAEDSTFPGLTISTDEEKTMLCSFYLTDEQMEMAENFAFVYDEMVEWEKTAEADIIMVFCSCDPWYAAAIPECDKANIQRVVVKSGQDISTVGHMYAVSAFDDESRELIYAALNELK